MAGTLNREEDEDEMGADPVSSAIIAALLAGAAPPATFLAVAAAVAGARRICDCIGDEDDIIVTGSRHPRARSCTRRSAAVMIAQQEELGDLKLYRIPEPVTVAAHAQKQVALLRARAGAVRSASTAPR